MENSIIINELKDKFTTGVLAVDETLDILTITIDKDVNYNLIQYLKEELGFIFITDVCGIHIPTQTEELGVIYHLHNLAENKRVRLKVFVSKENPRVRSIVSLFSGANWMERETYDFYGVEFLGHPNLVRILNVEYMDYHPMRKEYPLEDATREDKDDKFFGR